LSDTIAWDYHSIEDLADSDFASGDFDYTIQKKFGNFDVFDGICAYEFDDDVAVFSFAINQYSIADALVAGSTIDDCFFRLPSPSPFVWAGSSNGMDIVVTGLADLKWFCSKKVRQVVETGAETDLCSDLVYYGTRGFAGVFLDSGGGCRGGLRSGVLGEGFCVC